MNLSYYQRMTRRLGRPGHGGDFDPDSGVTHGVFGGETLCGVRVGQEVSGWFRDDHARTDSAISCKRCLRSVKRGA